jgi:hypothetical protein
MIRCVLSVLAVLGVSYTALSTIRPAWATELGIDVWNLPNLEQEFAQQKRFAAELACREAIARERTAGKDQVLCELLHGRLTLLQAAASFRHLDIEYPGVGPDYFPGRTEGERYCREVLQWVKVEAQKAPSDQTDEVLCRMTVELEDYLAANEDEVTLPEI